MMAITDDMVERTAKELNHLLPKDASLLTQKDIVRITRRILEAALSGKEE